MGRLFRYYLGKESTKIYPIILVGLMDRCTNTVRQSLSKKRWNVSSTGIERQRVVHRPISFQHGCITGLRKFIHTDDADDQGQPDELLVEGSTHYNEEEQCWVASIDWSAIRHASEDKSQDSVPLFHAADSGDG